jgi:hypothetical protein
MHYEPTYTVFFSYLPNGTGSWIQNGRHENIANLNMNGQSNDRRYRDKEKGGKGHNARELHCRIEWVM